jgi:ubiquinone/menaquinone biosynthesis C-methylase UbiE
MKRNFDEFDEFAENYRSIHTKNLKGTGGDSAYFSAYKVSEIAELEKATEIKKILDLGCGDGSTAYFFRKNFPLAKIQGLDVSEKSVSEAEKKELSNCSFKLYDGENIEYPDHAFDLVFIACVMHHIDAQLHYKILKECARVLKKEGYIYIFEHNPGNPFVRKIIKDCPFDKDAVLLKPGYIKKMLDNLGFSTEIRFTLFFPRFKLFQFLLFIEKYIKWLPLGGQYYARGKKN